MKLKKHDYILIGISIIIILITLILIDNGNKSNDNNLNRNEPRYSILKDYSRFFTLESCLYKYIVYLQSKDTDSLLKLLDSEYIKSNNITQDNILDFLGYLDGINTFKAKKIFYEKTNSDIKKYYIYGQIIEETIDSYNVEGTDKYYIVKMDTNNMTYSVLPCDENIFSEVSNG